MSQVFKPGVCLECSKNFLLLKIIYFLFKMTRPWSICPLKEGHYNHIFQNFLWQWCLWICFFFAFCKFIYFSFANILNTFPSLVESAAVAAPRRLSFVLRHFIWYPCLAMRISNSIQPLAIWPAHLLQHAAHSPAPRRTPLVVRRLPYTYGTMRYLWLCHWCWWRKHFWNFANNDSNNNSFKLIVLFGFFVCLIAKTLQQHAGGNQKQQK